jgi:hypothetical protein
MRRLSKNALSFFYRNASLIEIQILSLCNSFSNGLVVIAGRSYLILAGFNIVILYESKKIIIVKIKILIFIINISRPSVSECLLLRIYNHRSCTRDGFFAPYY